MTFAILNQCQNLNQWNQFILTHCTMERRLLSLRSDSVLLYVYDINAFCYYKTPTSELRKKRSSDIRSMGHNFRAVGMLRNLEAKNGICIYDCGDTGLAHTIS